MHVDAVLETCLYVTDLGAAERFYCDVLGLTVHSRQPDRHLFLRCGRQMVLLFLPDKTADPAGELPPHGAHGPGHVAFEIAESELEPWRQQLAARQVPIEREIAWPRGGHSLYFRDPAGNSLELATASIWGLKEPA